MTFETSTAELAQQLGARLKQARLNANLTQEAVAERAGINRKAIVNAEKGRGQLTSFIAVLVALDLADQLDAFLPQQPLSPLQLAKLQGEKRQRATGTGAADKEESVEW